MTEQERQAIEGAIRSWTLDDAEDIHTQVDTIIDALAPFVARREAQALAFRQRALDAEAALEAGGAEWTRMAEQHDELTGQVAGLREVLSQAEWVLSVEHESLSRHDNHGANYACKGCEALGKMRALSASEPVDGSAHGDEALDAADGHAGPVAGTFDTSWWRKRARYGR